MNTDIKLRVLDIVEGTSVDGPGLRTSIYFAGCRHHCHGCHNPQSWDENAGTDMTLAEIVKIVETNGFNVTFSGGDPLLQLPALTALAEILAMRGYSLWCYTGFTWESVLSMPAAGALLSHLEVLVDGPFIAQQRDTSLLFRGSSNQRLINVPESLATGRPVLFDPN